MYPAASLFGILIASLGVFASGQDRPVEKESAWQRLFREHAGEYYIVSTGNTPATATLVAEPVLKWSQPIRGGGDGAIYLWTHRGLPTAIGTFFIWPAGEGRQGVAHELHSLSASPLDAKWRDRSWTPPKDAIQWRPVPNGPPVAMSADKRLRQLRELARQFEATSRDPQGKAWELRLLARPLYRYERPESEGLPLTGEPLDLSLFGFVEGTDLEVVILLQAIGTESNLQWQYAFARLSDYQLTVQHQRETVWEVERSGPDKPREAYHCTTVEYRMAP